MTPKATARTIKDQRSIQPLNTMAATATAWTNWAHWAHKDNFMRSMRSASSPAMGAVSMPANRSVKAIMPSQA